MPVDPGGTILGFETLDLENADDIVDYKEISYIDDLVFSIFVHDASLLESTVIKTAEVIINTLKKYKFEANLSKGKTEAVLLFLGKAVKRSNNGFGLSWRGCCLSSWRMAPVPVWLSLMLIPTLVPSSIRMVIWVWSCGHGLPLCRLPLPLMLGRPFGRTGFD